MKVPNILEPRNLCRLDGRRPDGVTVFPWREGKCLLQEGRLLRSTLFSTIRATYRGPTENPTHGNFPARSIWERASSKIADGDVRGAVRILSSSEVFTQVNEETLKTLNQKHPPSEAPKLPTFPIAASKSPCSVKELISAISSFASGSGHGQAAKIGVELNTSKYELSVMNTENAVSQIEIHNSFTQLAPNIKIISRAQLPLLGSCVFDINIPEDIVQIAPRVELLCVCTKELPSH
ncbi:hypothetical protein ACOME3_010494 [Neoechinorhynchus agilis]